MSKVYFIGAGPGDPDLLTIKARIIIETADVIIVADSLVNPDVCSYAKHDARVYKSSTLTLEDIAAIITDAVKQGLTVARLHSGDPSIYGAIAEQISLISDKGIQYEIIPGVSSLFAAAAQLKIELTVPEITQTVIITRYEGRTPVPEKENLRSLAAHGATIALFLSIAYVEAAVEDLISGGYQPHTPVAVVYKASWKDQIIVRTVLKDLAIRIEEQGIKKHALILVGKALDGTTSKTYSKLYDPDFKHEYRQ